MKIENDYKELWKKRKKHSRKNLYSNNKKKQFINKC